MASRFPFALSGPRALPNSYSSGAFSMFALLLMLFVVISGCVREEDITLEQRAHQLSGQLMCPVCDAQTIDGSSAQIAVDMRMKVRELLDEGNTNAEVKDYFVLRYGEEILAAPEGSGFSLLAWIVPVVIVFGGVGIALVTIRNMRKSRVRLQPVTERQQADLSDYLAQVDRDLGVSGEAISSELKAPSEQADEANS
jgi:cytochrome c-type biogenesis protein CcmH